MQLILATKASMAEKELEILYVRCLMLTGFLKYRKLSSNSIFLFWVIKHTEICLKYV